jgi:hypothetical protein
LNSRRSSRRQGGHLPVAAAAAGRSATVGRAIGGARRPTSRWQLVEIGSAALAALIEAGWLDRRDAGDRLKIGEVIGRMLADAARTASGRRGGDSRGATKRHRTAACARIARAARDLGIVPTE